MHREVPPSTSSLHTISLSQFIIICFQIQARHSESAYERLFHLSEGKATLMFHVENPDSGRERFRHIDEGRCDSRRGMVVCSLLCDKLISDSGARNTNILTRSPVLVHFPSSPLFRGFFFFLVLRLVVFVEAKRPLP